MIALIIILNFKIQDDGLSQLELPYQNTTDWVA